MPGKGHQSKELATARIMLEYCRFSYKMYAQTCVYPLDPFYEAHGKGLIQGARDRVMAQVHASKGTQANATKFDPIEYDLTTTPDPSEGVVYNGNTENQPLTLLQPRWTDKSIAYAKGFDLTGTAVDGGVTPANPTGAVRCCYFQGRTGMTQNHPTAGWTSWLGAVLYNPANREVVIVFRGSRSGAGGRALLQAQLKSIGSPDWVTDMNHLKGVAVQALNGATMACGFWYAFDSCRTSLIAAIHDALQNDQPTKVYITGHSLGGALATCAYLDLMMGNAFHQELIGSRNAVNAEVSCYPLSAPPVVLGREAHRQVCVETDATHIYHYFCRYDSVHDSPLISTSVTKFGSWVMGAFSHPRTAPRHLGSEISLSVEEPFPNAHELWAVWRGLNNNVLDPEFWPTFTFDFLKARGPFIQGLPQGLDEELRLALKHSISGTKALARAELWLKVVKDFFRMLDVVDSYRDHFQRAVALVNELGTPVSPQVLLGRRERGTGSIETLSEKKRRLGELRASLLEVYAGAKDHKASSAVMWTLLQYLTAGQVWLKIN